MRRFAVAAILAATLQVPAPARAHFQCDDNAAQREHLRTNMQQREVFRAKRFAELDRHYNKILADVASGRITDAEANFAFEMFHNDQPENEALHAEWIKLTPKSEAAHLAEGYYFTHRGWVARGESFAAETSSSQFAGMHSSFERAMKSIDAAERLSRHPTLEWAARIEVLRAYGGTGRKQADALYRQAIEKYPSTVVVRTQYAVGRTARWGGGVREAEQVAEEAKGLPEPQRRYVDGIVQWNLGIDADNMKDAEQAIMRYERMIADCPAFAAGRLLRHYGNKRDWAKMIATAQRVIANRPADGEAYAYRGWAFDNTHKLAESVADYKRAAELGWVRAYLNLANLYEQGAGVPRDLDKALELYTVAYQKGIPEAKVGMERVRALMKRKP